MTRAAELALLSIAMSVFADIGGAQEMGWGFNGGVTAISLHPRDSQPEGDQTLSADLYLQHRGRNGNWFVYVEGNSSLDTDAASTILIEANADAGTALDPDRSGRIQISEINYRTELGDGAFLTIGLLDASGYLDRTRITNDENVQFLGASFVNNPTIAFPDYTVSMVYERPAEGVRPQVNAVLASANGLADNPNLSYSQLLRLTDDNDGAFAAIGLGWPSERHLIRVGAWVNTRPHGSLDGSRDDATNYGAYAVYGRSWHNHGLNVRIGLANEELVEGAQFASIAYRFRWRQHALGAGIARTYLSPAIDDLNRDDSTQLELFGRFNLTPTIHFTVSIQRLIHSGLVSAASDPRESARLVGARFHVSF
ncbi:MAG: carbohydrate porin [Gammaproteobacteria bacterium]|nr:carbohydrate porin [Gammaproteobacteria bacterium]MDH3506159.1 carbohydrate porin [Gammaproteobacteria bacterium]